MGGDRADRDPGRGPGVGAVPGRGNVGGAHRQGGPRGPGDARDPAQMAAQAGIAEQARFQLRELEEDLKLVPAQPVADSALLGARPGGDAPPGGAPPAR